MFQIEQEKCGCRPERRGRPCVLRCGAGRMLYRDRCVCVVSRLGGVFVTYGEDVVESIFEDIIGKPVESVPYNWRSCRGGSWRVSKEDWERFKAMSEEWRSMSDGTYQTRSVSKGEIKMYEKIKREVWYYGKIIALGVGTFALANIGAWAAYVHGGEIQRAYQTGAQAQGRVEKMNAGVQAMSQELIALKHDKTTKVVVKYTQGK